MIVRLRCCCTLRTDPWMAMPRFSVIVPARGVQGFLRHCLDSVLTQSFEGVELIAVDDCSDGGDGAIIDAYAAADHRVIALHLERPGGVGPARNAGVRRATGEYLLFLDGDDFLAPGALAAIDARLRAAGEPDVLLFDHDRIDVWEKRHPSADREFLEAHADTVFTAEDVPECLSVLPAPWNRAVRRDLWEEHRFAFADGPYDDVPVVFGVLLAAARIACLDQVCVTWRKRRRGSASTVPGRHHFAVLGRYDAVFRALTGSGTGLGGGTEAARGVLFAHAAGRLLRIMEDDGRVRAGDRADFYRELARLLRRHRPAGAELPAHLNSYAVYRSLQRAGTLRHRTAKTLRSRRHRTARSVYRRYYGLQLRRPVDENLVVYAAYWNRGVLCSPAAIHAKARELAPQLRGVWVVDRRHREDVPPGVETVLVNSRRYWEVMARAKYLVNNANFPGTVHKRPEQIYIQTHHGTPLKKMGMDLRRHPAAAQGVSFLRMLDHADQWDYCLSSNPHSTEVWQRVYPSDYETLPTGYPRNDRYFTATAEDVRRIRAGLGIVPGTTAILYAPTHRDYERGFSPPLDLERLAEALGEGYQLLVRTHYFYGADSRLAALEEAGRILDVSRHPSVEDLALASDALLCDFSSLMFDYAALDRPVVVHSSDWEAYRHARGVYFDLLSGEPGDTPGHIAADEQAIAEVFRSGRWTDDRSTELRAAFRERFCPYDDGLAAERVVRRVFLGEDTLLPVIPLAERTAAPPPHEAEDEAELDDDEPAGVRAP
ncbi:bifunctional glycosyltransferase/CDP-glycerol:glycerophosphate glycerophosphotransferase [Streptomyces purpurogeneiscleroticus]|uniref:bifunctional glycosyltransferase/CDP-glycerol:glycerophosphate glycerophosphotransferase n=1 Tax=Streptomyces purpurogeneiscleroticus TaxID=68259 RepID=UPI0027DFEF29|nr:CDP-glycerol:glycerophosphate glycerophosphotransferase [Streptomyces purpurogeneiscleroticus]